MLHPEGGQTIEVVADEAERSTAPCANACTLRLRAVAFVVVMFALLVFGREKMFRDPGTLWHTVVGERMLGTGQVVRFDWLSYTEEGSPWPAQQWLAEIGMALIHRAAGLDGLLLATAVILAWTFSSLAGRLALAGLPWSMLAVLLILVAGASSYHFMPRPHLATIALMAWTAGLLMDVEAGRMRAAALLWLPIVFTVWTNLHGGALGGIVTAELVIVGWLLSPLVTGKRRTASPMFLCVVSGLSAASVLINPYGLKLPTLWIGLMDSDLLPKVIVEHAPLKIVSVEGAMISALGCIYGAALIGARRHWRISWFMPGLWLVMAFGRVRHGPLFAVMAAVAIADMLPHTGMARWLSARGALVPMSPAALPMFWRWAPVSLVAVVFVVQCLGVRLPVIGAEWCRLSAEAWPVDATSALRRALAEDPAHMRVFNELGWGGYLIYFVPEAKVFIDDRCELYGDAGLNNYIDILRRPERIEDLAHRDEVRLALVRAGSRMDRYLASSDNWSCLHADRIAAAYARRGGSSNVMTTSELYMGYSIRQR